MLIKWNDSIFLQFNWPQTVASLNNQWWMRNCREVALKNSYRNFFFEYGANKDKSNNCSRKVSLCCYVLWKMVGNSYQEMTICSQMRHRNIEMRTECCYDCVLALRWPWKSLYCMEGSAITYSGRKIIDSFAMQFEGLAHRKNIWQAFRERIRFKSLQWYLMIITINQKLLIMQKLKPKIY